jgi:hypothetical protein
MTMRSLLAFCVSALLPAAVAAQPRTTPPPHVHNRTLSTVTEGGRQVFRLDQKAGDGVAWWPEPFTTGTIELDLRGRDVAQGSFVGVAFHGVDEKTYEAVYFRPFNFKTEDAARRLRAVQYVSHPEHPWPRLREQQPGVYEKPVVPPPDPNGWFHATIHLTPDTITVFVDPAASPALVVQRLTTRAAGWVGLWVGNESPGDFANVTVRGLGAGARAEPAATPAAASFAGTYVGKVQPEQGDAVDLRFVITEREGATGVSGGPGDGMLIPARNLVRRGDSLTFVIDAPSDTPNQLAFDVTVKDGAVTGTVVQTRDGQVRTGRLTLTRQP